MLLLLVLIHFTNLFEFVCECEMILLFDNNDLILTLLL